MGKVRLLEKKKISMKTTIIRSKRQWEKNVDGNSPVALFQRWDWGEIQKQCGAKAFCFGYFKKNTCIGVALAVIVKAKRGNFLHVRHGPILADWDAKTFASIISHLKKIAREEYCVCVRISPCIENNEEYKTMFHKTGGIPAAIHAMDAEYSLVLDVGISEEQILANMRKTTRYEIRKAQKLGVSIEKSTDPKSLSVFFDLYNKTAIRQGFVEHKSIKEEFGVFASENRAVHIMGIVDGKPIASAIILFVGSEAIYRHGASVHSSIPASYLVQWEAICEAKRRGMDKYNFWGISPTDDHNHPWYGLTLFKKGFGGYVRETLHAYDFPVSRRYWAFRIIELVRKRIRGYL